MKEIMKKSAGAGAAVGAISAYGAFLVQMWS
ncbi:hypothetical protein SAMN04488598_10654 [Halanaerobium congolense]|jgi:hypothetical protein|uniref:Uncharacterized protein n=1 Tax=Halanaerobium congolense TaxID=54121 RepID=A0A1G6MF44_9FIRM|nr:MAG: hypothetical protein AWL62_540 [Halanaerobium sp. T82-1]PTX17270.1 hypothetical protein C7953_2040 [Halanaerobium congolense]PUU93577.1 MAG: metal dependent phosphohydrolase [Halanaerobium sp.]PXV66972.1 hypothetical protein C8C78_10922 [Halanaerobium congolense]TDP25640.1 hypothetical protein C8C79_10660 [Halanaerobium congolense]